tara:strand:- start:455 stop:631 length:177 start_codon:yes stop_codon:yes gene_type:complete
MEKEEKLNFGKIIFYIFITWLLIKLGQFWYLEESMYCGFEYAQSSFNGTLEQYWQRYC